MDFSLDEEQTAVHDLARRILAPRAPTTDAEYPSVAAMTPDTVAWRQLAEANLLGISFSEAAGGSGLGLTAAALVVEQAGAAALRAPVVDVLAAALTVDCFGTDEQRRGLLAGVAAGERLVGLALSEALATEPLTPTTLAAPDGAGWTVTGEKAGVADAARLERALVSARTPDDEVVLLLVDPAASGARLHAQHTSSGEPQCSLTLDGVTVGADDVVAGPGHGYEALAWCLGRARLLTAALALGLAQQQLELTAAYVSEREQFGVPIGTFQGVAMRVANMLVDVEAMRATLWQALWRIDAGLDHEEELTIAKFWASEGGERVASSAVHLHGGIGVDTDYPLHHYFLRSKVAELSLGSASWQLDHLGHRITARAGAPA